MSTTVSAGSLIGIVSSPEVMPIGKVLENPRAIHMQLVQLEGTVRDIESLKPHEPYQPGDPCFGAYTFNLNDPTGTVRIEVLGHRLNCGTAIGEERPEVHDGDRVRVEVRIQAPGTYIDRMISPLPVEKSTLQAIATRIRRLKE
ncbi:hypothetical protein [Candidatus Nitrospira nitrosa]|uniref:hypothetical protein n=1 Tax=Candidatus Nitrospira nitrosa TaxID=1742972 RepID=UPI00159ECD6D|nr:hypothetical protein [Candidatus Nitrospira nitrosa]